jgi:uncharacterized SAM-binding protein YcdF (DUF218 family)
MPSSARPLLRILKWLLIVFILLTVILMLWGSELLIAADPVPSHVDAAVVLQGSILAEKARLAGAIGLLRRGVADRLLLNIPRESYWGQSIPPVARAYVEHAYGSDIAARIDFCEMGAEVNSTAQEAEAAMGCVQEHHWRGIAVVTSDYHTRRAGMLWRRTIKRRDPAMHVTISGVLDPEFQKPWWRHRQSAKIWFEECLKLAWTTFGG